MSKTNFLSSEYILSLMPQIMGSQYRVKNTDNYEPVNKHKRQADSNFKPKTQMEVKKSNQSNLSNEFVKSTKNKKTKATFKPKTQTEVKKSHQSHSLHEFKKNNKPNNTIASCKSNFKFSKNNFAQPKLTEIKSNKSSNLALNRRKKSTNLLSSKIKLKTAEGQSKASIFERLSTPKTSITEPEKSPWTLTEAMKNFKPSERLIQLSKLSMSKKDIVYPTLSEVLTVKRSALTYNPTPRIQQLAAPKIWLSESDQDPFKVSPKALTAIPSEHIRQLAFPKRRIERNHRKNRFKVKNSAFMIPIPFTDDGSVQLRALGRKSTSENFTRVIVINLQDTIK